MFKNFLKKPIGFKLSALWLFAVLFITVTYDLFPFVQWDRISDFSQGDGPFKVPGHILGTSYDGMDMFTATMHGARMSTFVALVSVIIGGGIGSGLGIAAAYYRGTFDKVMSSIFNMILAIPNLVMSLALISVLANGNSNEPASDFRRVLVLTISLTIVIIPILGRIARSSTLQWSSREFVLASKSIGTKNLEIIRRHIIPNVAPAILAIGFFAVGVVMIAEGSLSILGIGVPGGASWGSLLAIGRANLEYSPHEVYIPVACIGLTVISTNYFGDYIRANLDKRESKI
ncbi:MAG: ABC transporter permease subunit [Actinobacteria bacterium]|nr:ABC transporter permease subunit [Actinomycetota bacterium]